MEVLSDLLDKNLGKIIVRYLAHEKFKQTYSTKHLNCLKELTLYPRLTRNDNVKHLLDREFRVQQDSYRNITYSTISIPELLVPFNNNYGCCDQRAFRIWTRS